MDEILAEFGLRPAVDRLVVEMNLLEQSTMVLTSVRANGWSRNCAPAGPARW